MRVGFIDLETMGRNAAASVRRPGICMVAYDFRPETFARHEMTYAMQAKFGQDIVASLRLAGDGTPPWEVQPPAD
jgi:6-phosphogluconate dehydrogenase (decarboxylating)